MATLRQVARLGAALPDVVELDRRGVRTWVVTGRTFAWERPFAKADVSGDRRMIRLPSAGACGLSQEGRVIAAYA